MLKCKQCRVGVYRFEKVAPFLIAAEKGTFQLCQYVMKKSKEKNPQINLQIWINHLDKQSFHISNFIPRKHQRNTIFHTAALRGNLELCQLIMDNVDDYNPKNCSNYTPLLIAAANGHLEVCRLIIERQCGDS